MSISSEQRRLAAIMFTDMVGYTALSQRNEALALELLEEHRRILRSIFPRFNGTEIKTIGDAFLVEFQSALEAAQCALEIQRTLAKRNHDVSREHRIELRIGIHVGDVVHREGDVYGDGVNIASRIQPVAGIGGICISVDVERQIHNALEARFEKLAPIELKNVQVPMDLFRIVLPWERDVRLKPECQKPDVGQRRSIPIGWLVAAMLLLALIGGGIFVFQLVRSSAHSHLEGGVPATPAAQGLAGARPSIPEKSIAVLPFENLSRDPDNAYFADGIQEEILTRLAKIADLKVISRTSTQHFKSSPDNLPQIAKQLGVTNILEGSVQKAADQVRVNVQLINATTDAHLWAESFDRKLTDIFAVESDIATTIAEQLQAKITGIEKQEIAAKATNNAEAYDAYLRGLALYFRGFKDIDLVNSTKSLEEAVRLDPKFAQAWALLARGHGNLYFFGLDTTPARREAARNALARAEELQPDLAETQLAKAWYLFRVERDYERAKRVCEGLRPKWPNNSEVPTLMSYVLARQGHIAEAEVQLQEALTLDPRSALLLKVFALSAIQNRRFADALKRLDRVLDVAPGDTDAISRKALVYQAVGELDNAEAVLAPLQSATADANTASALAQQRLLQRRYPAGIALLQSSLAKADPALKASRSLDRISLGDLQRLAGDAATARASYAQARDELEAQLKQQPDNTGVMLGLARAYAGLQDRKLALQHAEKALELRPESQDVLVARKYQETLARIASQVGETDRAIKILQHLLTVPYIDPPITPALLRLDPTWDPLRGDPRFQELCKDKQP